MKVLIVNSVPTEKNGITNVIFNFLSKMDSRGIQIDLISINNPEGKYRDIIEQKGGTLFILERKSKRIIHYLISLKRIIRSRGYDVVHIHGNSHTLVLELLAAKLGGCKVRIAHAHNTTCNSIMIHRVLTPFFNMLCTNKLACGIEAGIWMFGSNSFKVLNNGVDLEAFSFNEVFRNEIRRKYGLNKTKVIGHVGAFTPVKNQSFIIDLLYELTQKDDSFSLMLIGEGPLMKDLENKVIEKGLIDKVIFTGGVHNVNEFLNAIDIIVMPSLYEGLPLTLIEQQANGLQCFIADTITKEVDKTGNVEFISLGASKDIWVNKIVSVDCLNGRSERSLKACRDIAYCGYSIEDEAEKLRDYYRGLITE